MPKNVIHLENKSIELKIKPEVMNESRSFLLTQTDVGVRNASSFDLSLFIIHDNKVTYVSNTGKSRYTFRYVWTYIA